MACNVHSHEPYPTACIQAPRQTYCAIAFAVRTRPMHLRFRPHRDASQALCGIGPGTRGVHVVRIHVVRRRECRRGLHTEWLDGDVSRSSLHRRRCGAHPDRFAPCLCAFCDARFGNPACVQQLRWHDAQLCTRRSRRMLRRRTTRCGRSALRNGLRERFGGHAREAPSSTGMTT